MDLTDPQKFELVALFMSGLSANDACEEFHQRHPDIIKPHSTTCLKFFTRLKETGSVACRPNARQVKGKTGSRPSRRLLRSHTVTEHEPENEDVQEKRSKYRSESPQRSPEHIDTLVIRSKRTDSPEDCKTNMDALLNVAAQSAQSTTEAIPPPIVRVKPEQDQKPIPINPSSSTSSARRRNSKGGRRKKSAFCHKKKHHTRPNRQKPYPISVHMEFHRLWKMGVTWKKICALLAISRSSVTELSKRYRLLDKHRINYPFCKEIQDCIADYMEQNHHAKAKEIRNLLIKKGLCTKRSTPTLATLDLFLKERFPIELPKQEEDAKIVDTGNEVVDSITKDNAVDTVHDIPSTRPKTKRKAERPSKAPPLEATSSSSMFEPSGRRKSWIWLPTVSCAQDPLVKQVQENPPPENHSPDSVTAVAQFSPLPLSQLATALNHCEESTVGDHHPSTNTMTTTMALQTNTQHPQTTVKLEETPLSSTASICPGSIHWLAIDGNSAPGLSEAKYLGIVYLGHDCWRPVILPQGFAPAGQLGSSQLPQGTGIEASYASYVDSKHGPVLSIG